MTNPTAIGERLGLGLNPKEAHGLLNRRRWREYDVATLQAVAGRLGLEVVPHAIGRPSGNQQTR